jgi:hypothetical protein
MLRYGMQGEKRASFSPFPEDQYGPWILKRAISALSASFSFIFLSSIPEDGKARRSIDLNVA